VPRAGHRHARPGGPGTLAARYPNELSGGEQQRVALGRALVADTGLILCDEPLSNLDADLRERMRVEISSLVREAGATTMYITHDQAEAFALADRVGVLERGHLVQVGTPEEIYTQPASPFVARFTGLSGEFPVRIRGGGDGGTVEVEAAGLAGSRPRVPRPWLRACHRPAGLRPPDRRVRQRPVGPGRAGRPAARAGRLPRLPASRPGPGAAPARRGDGGPPAPRADVPASSPVSPV
jgi:hypothetical protein